MGRGARFCQGPLCAADRGRVGKSFTVSMKDCAAIVDRLTFSGNIIEIDTDSYRLAATRARADLERTAG